MSGGVDMSLPKEQELLHEETCDPKQQQHRGMKLGRKKPAVFLSFRHLNMLALMVIFSASGLVCAEDLAFVVLSIMYTYFLSRVAFPRLEGEEPTVFSQQNKLLQQYVLFAAVVGLFLPIAYILVGFFQDDQEGIKAASPHVFLLASQVPFFLLHHGFLISVTGFHGRRGMERQILDANPRVCASFLQLKEDLHPL